MQPAQETPEVEQQSINSTFPTTDTGTKYENTIKVFTDIIWWFSVVGTLFTLLIVLSYFDNFDSVIIFATIIGSALYLVLLYCMLAFIRVIRNISINLHEINMKTKG